MKLSSNYGLYYLRLFISFSYYPGLKPWVTRLTSRAGLCFTPIGVHFFNKQFMI